MVLKLLSKLENTDYKNVWKIVKSWTYFEFFNSEKVINQKAKHTFDVLCDVSLEKLQYKEGERDLVIMKHIFTIEEKDGSHWILNSTMVAVGDPKDTKSNKGYSIMCKTVGYPTSIAAEMILEGKIKHWGVISPIYKEIYEPILDWLENEYHIKLTEEYD